MQAGRALAGEQINLARDYLTDRKLKPCTLFKNPKSRLTLALRRYAKFLEHGRTLEWYTYSHVISQLDFTHDPATGRQMVRTIFRQEELKPLKAQPAAFK